MSRTATATPPPPYFPQRTSTPTLRHCAAPTVTAAHFASRSNSHQHVHTHAPEKGRRRIKHLPPSLGGLKAGSGSASASSSGSSVGKKDKAYAVKNAGNDAGNGNGGLQDLDGEMEMEEADIVNSTCKAANVSMSTSTGSLDMEVELEMDQDPPILSPLSKSPGNAHPHPHFAAIDREAPAPPINNAVVTPNPPSSSSSSRSWVPHFGFGKVAKAVVSSGISIASAPWSNTDRKKDGVNGGKAALLAPLEIPPSPSPSPALAPFILDIRPCIGVDNFDDHTFTPRARADIVPPSWLYGLDEEGIKAKKREWAEAQHQRLTECARLCSQWPLSGYNMSKWGPNGPKHNYEPQSYINPEHVAGIMARQATLEQVLSSTDALYFPSSANSSRYTSARNSRYPSSSNDSADSVDNSALPSPTTTTRTASTASTSVSGDIAKVDAQTAADIKMAMASPLLFAANAPASTSGSAASRVGSNNASQVSLLLPSLAVAQPNGQAADRSTSRSPGGHLKNARGLTELKELNALASSMMLSRPSRSGNDNGVASGNGEDMDMEVETDTTSIAPSLASLATSDLIESNPLLPSTTTTIAGLSKVPTRPTRAQSCGSKRPLPTASVEADEEKRRKVDEEAMVVEEAVSTGVIQPSSPVNQPSLGLGNKARLCASTPDLGRSSSKSPATATASGTGTGICPDAAPALIPNGAVFGHVVKTSDTHPIIISSFFPADLLPVLATHMTVPHTPTSHAQYPIQLSSNIDVPALLLSHTHAAQFNGASPTPIPVPVPVQVPSPVSSSFTFPDVTAFTSAATTFGPRRLGNLFLSSCPGKRLRMEGPVKGRGPVCRDIKTDLARIKAEGVGCLVCCLDDTELALLGTPWETYRDVANDIGLDIIRNYTRISPDRQLTPPSVPMPDGFTPVSLALFDSQITRIASGYTLKGINVLVHCRGGVGRAGVTACAWAIKMGFVQPHPSLALVEEAARRKSSYLPIQINSTSSSTSVSSPTPSSATATNSVTPNTERRVGFPFFSHSSRSGSTSTVKPPPPTPPPAAAPPSTETSLAPSADQIIPPELEHQIVMSIVERVIAMIRSRRGLKAIESFEQVQFLAVYVRWLRAGGRVGVAV